jgi:hypothetical protein
VELLDNFAAAIMAAAAAETAPLPFTVYRFAFTLLLRFGDEEYLEDEEPEEEPDEEPEEEPDEEPDEEEPDEEEPDEEPEEEPDEEPDEEEPELDAFAFAFTLFLFGEADLDLALALAFTLTLFAGAPFFAFLTRWSMFHCDPSRWLPFGIGPPTRP